MIMGIKFKKYLSGFYAQGRFQSLSHLRKVGQQKPFICGRLSYASGRFKTVRRISQAVTHPEKPTRKKLIFVQ